MPTHLVLGGTGKTGRRLTRRLSGEGHVVRAGARTPGRAAPRVAPPRLDRAHATTGGAARRRGARPPGRAAPGVEPGRCDWDDDTTWGPALAGTDGAYLIPPALRTDHPPLLGRPAGQGGEGGGGGAA